MFCILISGRVAFLVISSAHRRLNSRLYQFPCECKGKEPSGENNKAINFPLKNNLCMFLRRETLMIST